ncbi:MAG TPA: hypothetical protein PKA32_00190 [Candidatus Gracilibacteria bacterium]|nr:hypothetical protein [Candidatus Gracilibacteria bacterium]
MIFGNIEAFEPSSEKESKTQNKKESKTNLYYKPFKKKEGVRIDKGEDEEKQIELKKLEKELDKAGKNEELVKRFQEVSKKLQPRKLWTKVMVAGEIHHIEFVSLQKQNKIVSVESLESEIPENPNTLKTIIANFSLKKTEGRPESLFLTFKTTLTNILEGGGSVKKTLATLLEHQFAGTERYYKRLEEASEQTQKEEPPEFKADKAQLIGKLQKQGAQITELEGAKAYTIIATFPQESKQLHISTVNKEEWNVLEVKNQKKTESTNLRPQEIINKHIEQQQQ